MIRSLEIKNLILIENCKIEFSPGLTILSGETGAGKTALTQAIGLILGERAESSYIRKGEEKASVEALFAIEELPLLHALLEEAGIDFDRKDFLVIRRELTQEGRNRAFINCQMATLPLLLKVGSHLIDLIGQHSHQELRSSDYHRKVVDLFGELHSPVAQFNAAWSQEKIAAEKLSLLLESSEKRELELATCRRELEEILEVNPKDDEEEKLFEEYQRLSHGQELTEKVGKLYQGLFDAPQALAPLLYRYKNSCSALLQMDPTLQAPLDLLQNACLALEEVSPLLTSYLGKLESEPSRLAFLDERLKALHRLKKKFGNFLETSKKELQERVYTLENLDISIEETRNQLEEAKKQTAQCASLLTSQRRSAAERLQLLLTQSLQSLNMTGAELKIRLSSQMRSSTGEDLLTFWLHANTGEEAVSVKEGSSGGELSRLLLAIKTTLAEKNNTPTLIFDEIDANVGGETAALIGTKLQTLSQHRQVLCITHFPQVACKADTHLRVQKEVVEERTIARIETLDKEEKKRELMRMLGGKKILLTSLLIALMGTAFSDDEEEGIPSMLREGEWISESTERGRPFRLDANYRAVGKAKFKEGAKQLSSLLYADSLDTVSFSHYVTDSNLLTWQAGYSYLKLDWDKNPRFRQENFNYGLASLTWTSHSITNWRLLFNFGISADAHHFDLGNTGVYSGMAWGRYEYTDNLHFHLGFFGYVGVENHYILPILGIDWKIEEKWKLNAIFPWDFSLTYTIDDHWSTALAFAAFGGPYRFPRRAEKGIGSFHNAIFEVYAKGMELDLTYQHKPHLTAGIGAGWNFGGWILIKDAHNHHGKYFKFGAAPYAQGNVTFNF